MTHIRYDIIPQGGGWSIAMGGAVGPPYPTLQDAVSDTEFVATILVEAGDRVEIVVWRGGEPHQLQVMDPKPKARRQTAL